MLLITYAVSVHSVKDCTRNVIGPWILLLFVFQAQPQFEHLNESLTVQLNSVVNRVKHETDTSTMNKCIRDIAVWQELF